MESEKKVDEIEDQLRSNSLEDVQSCSSSILDTPPRRDEDGNNVFDDDEFEDGINVTILAMPENVLTQDKEGVKSENQNHAPPQKIPLKRLNGAAKKRYRYLLN